eukprot:TRINITY_DN72865_c0_g1_i1.p1 TRINITY_DN72865_c0_g1~~TRINITY_DN72865_c0_g1_i1.p1  ORF type:complete len:122 (-),score=18.47 TRINITY_DN72865_c0_g1_i1:291-656(-)
MAAEAAYKGRQLIAVIGDEDTVTGMLLAGVGHVDKKQKKNFLLVDNKTTVGQIEEAFLEFTTRTDIAVLMINQHVASDIRPIIEAYDQAFPALLEIPSKDHPYDPKQDSMLKKIEKMFERD